MEYIDSKAEDDIVQPTKYSADSVRWQPIPDGINVIGSRYALVLDEIRPGELEVPFQDFVVAIGKSRGRNASDYIAGRVDKGCLIRASRPTAAETPAKVRK